VIAVKIGVFIPAWNVHRQVVGVLEKLPAAFGRRCAEVFVLDNASSDGTAQAALARIRRGLPYPARVYRNDTNLGYGGTQKVAYAHALEQGFDLVAMLHGDGQYPASQIPNLVAALAHGEAGMAYGSRFLRGTEKDHTPLNRVLGVWGLSVLQNLLSGVRLAEWYSGFRAFRCDALRQVPFQACDNDYYFDVQIILLLSMINQRIAEIPVAKSYDDEPSPVNIYQFGRKVLARMPYYPLARCGLLRSRLYDRRCWPELMRTPVSAPVPVRPAWEAEAC
jgi:glycosyltransferase involved in cell wall biosynthesis